MLALVLPIRLRRHGKSFVGKGFGDVETDWAKPIAVTGEIDYTWSTPPIDVTGVDQFGNVLISQTPTV
jgi:hypothetical protein